MMTDAYGKVEVFAEGGLEHYVANVSWCDIFRNITIILEW